MCGVAFPVQAFTCDVFLRFVEKQDPQEQATLMTDDAYLKVLSFFFFFITTVDNDAQIFIYILQLNAYVAINEY